MAFSLGSSRRRWPCRAARRGGKGGAGCRHFHVHYHFPLQVCAFIPLRLPAFFSLLPYLLIPLVLFFAVLAFLVCFGWFTLVYFVSALLRKCNSHECLQSTNDAKELCREEQGGKKAERAAKCVAECTVDFSTAEVCVEGEQIKEVFVDGFSDEYCNMSRLDLTDDCADDEDHVTCEKLVEEVMIFETNSKKLREISYLDVCSEKDQLQDTPVDCFAEEISNIEFSTSCDTANIFHPQSVEEFMENRMKVSANAWTEIFELTDKHETSSDNSAHDCPEDEGKKEVEQEKYLKYRADLTDDIFGNKLPEDIFEEQHDEQKMVTDHISAISDETNDLNDETVGLPFDSVCESKYSTVITSNASFHHTSSYEDDGHEEDVTENDRAKATDTTSLVSDFAENHQAIIRDEISVSSNIDNAPEVAAQENSVNERTEDEEENSCTPEGAPRRLPLVRRSPPPWWNLCGVLDVLGGCKD